MGDERGPDKIMLKRVFTRLGGFVLFFCHNTSTMDRFAAHVSAESHCAPLDVALTFVLPPPWQINTLACQIPPFSPPFFSTVSFNFQMKPCKGSVGGWGSNVFKERWFKFPEQHFCRYRFLSLLNFYISSQPIS